MTESNRIEFKRQLTDTLEKEVVAFLNAKQGGEIYIGVDDLSQKPIRLTDLDDLQLKIKDRIDLIANEEYGYGCLIKVTGFTTTDQSTPQATDQLVKLLLFCKTPDKPSSPKQKYQTTQATQGQGHD
jgi:hypothetical protein